MSNLTLYSLTVTLYQMAQDSHKCEDAIWEGKIFFKNLLPDAFVMLILSPSLIERINV